MERAQVLYDRLRRHGGAVLLASLLLYVGAADVYRASRTPFWFDEICTVLVVEQSSASGMWAALQRPIDQAAPMHHLVATLSTWCIGDKHVAYRVPSILGMICVSAALFVFARRRAGTVAGLVAATAAILGPLQSIHAVEARPYCMFAGCSALAILMWQQADRRGRALLMGLLLALATSFHYFGVFTLGPMALAEGVRYLRTRRFRLGVWCAIACGVLPLSAFWPLLSRTAALSGIYHFWAPARFVNLPSMYDYLVGIGDGWGSAIAVALIVALVVGMISILRRREASSGVEIPIEEWTLMLALLLLPVIICAGMKVSHGNMTARYAILASLGGCVSIAYLSARAGWRVSAWVLVLLLSAFAFQEGRAWMTDRRRPAASSVVYPELRTLETLRRRAAPQDLPLVISDGLSYLPMAYYAASLKMSPLLSLVDRRRAITYSGTDSVDRQLPVLARYLPMDVRAFSEFAPEHPRFLLYSSGLRAVFDWWPRGLAAEGYFLRPLAVEGAAILYLVEAPGAGAGSPGGAARGASGK